MIYPFLQGDSGGQDPNSRLVLSTAVRVLADIRNHENRFSSLVRGVPEKAGNYSYLLVKNEMFPWRDSLFI